MAENWIIEQTVELTRPVQPYVGQPVELMLPGDHLAHTLRIKCKERDMPVNLTGYTAAGYFKRTDGNTVLVVGSITGNTVDVTLSQECYAFSGNLRGVVRITNSTTDAKITLCDRLFHVGQAVDDGGTIDPGEVIPSLDDLLAEIDAMEQATAAAEAAADAVPDMVAPVFSTSAPYSAGSYVYYDGTLYRFTANHAAGAWNSAQAVAVTIGGEVADLKSASGQLLNYYDIQFVSGYYISDAGDIGSTVTLTPQSNSDYSYAIIDCEANETFTINAKGSTAGRLWAFIDSQNKLISISESNAVGENLVITAPENAVKLILNSNNSYLGKCYSGYVVKDIAETVSDMQESINEISDMKSEISHIIDGEDIPSADLWNSQDLLMGYYDTTGTFNQSTQFPSCNFIDISEYDYVLCRYEYAGSMPIIYDTWDASNNLLTGERVNKQANVDIVIRINVDSNTKFLTINTREITSTTWYSPTIIGYRINKSGIDCKGLRGKKISILGDSISTYAGYIPSGNEVYYTGSNCGVSSVDQTWWKRLIDYYGLELCINNSWSGATISSIRDQYYPGSSGVDRCESLNDGATNPDIIIIYMGTNDFRNNTPLGLYDGSQTFPITYATFRDAVAVMLKKILTKYPSAVTYICTLKQFENYGSVEGFPDKNGIGLTTDDYTKAILDMATLFGIPVIDFNKSGLNYFNLSLYCGDYDSSTGKGLHPNAEGHRKLFDRALHDLFGDEK